MTIKKQKKMTSEINRKEDLSIELHEMQFENMDFDVVKKIISDYVSDDVDITEEEDIDSSKDEKFLELVVESLDVGLKNASELFDVPIKEIKYKILEKVFGDNEADIKEHLRIEFQKKLVAGNSQLNISEDKLSAYFSVVFPKNAVNEEVDEKTLLKMIKEEGILYGVQSNNLKGLAAELKENYDAVKNVVIAEGIPSKKGSDSELNFSVFSKLEEINYKQTNRAYLAEILNTHSLKSIEENYFPVSSVNKGVKIASTSEPGNGIDGRDIFGDAIAAEKGKLLFKKGKNVEVKLEEGLVNYYSTIFGYLELEDGTISVHSPVWISEDFMKAYFIELPSIDGNVTKFDLDDIYNQLLYKNVKYGIIEEELEGIKFLRLSGTNRFSVKMIAQGDEVIKGDDAVIDLFFDKDTKPGKILEDGRIDYREIDVIKTVKANQLLASKLSEKEGTPGKNLKGDIIPAQKGASRQFNAMNNVKAVTSKEKTLYFSTIEGRVVLVGDNGISVNKVFEIAGDVNFSTGNIDFNGDVNIKGSVNTGFKVNAQGNIMVKGMVNQGVELISEGNISIKQGVVGKNNNTILKAKGMVIAQYIQNAFVESLSDIVVKDYIMNSIIRTKGNVYTPDSEKSLAGKGSIVGGEIIAARGIIANSIGSDHAKMTKIKVGIDFNFDTRVKNFNKGVEYCDQEVSKLSKFLKIGFQDIDTLKKRIAKLPAVKQKPFHDAFKKLREINKFRSDIKDKRAIYLKENNELSKSSEIKIKKELFSRVVIQIGEAKYKTETSISGVRLKGSVTGKKVESVSLAKSK